MDARSLKTPSGKLYWVVGAGEAEDVPWDDDVADVAVAFLNMNAVDPVPVCCSHPCTYPTWARQMMHHLAQSPLLARAVLTQCEAMPMPFLIMGAMAAAVASGSATRTLIS